MKTIYICGLAEPHDENIQIDSRKLKSRLTALNCSMVNPLKLHLPQTNWSDTLHNRLELIKKSNGVYVAPKWREDVMARIELTCAMDMNKPTLFHPASNKELKHFITTLDG